MAKFRDGKTLQKFAAAHASIHNNFNQDRQLFNTKKSAGAARQGAEEEPPLLL